MLNKKTPAIGWSAYGGKTESGFSLVEVLMTIFILSVGVTGVFALLAGNIKDMQNTRDQIIASMLAQEGIELFREIKDSNPDNFSSEKKCGLKLLDGSYRLAKNSNAYVADCTAPPFTTTSDRAFYIDDGNTGCPTTAGFYTYPLTCGALNRTKSKFYREIKVFNNTTAKQVEMVSVVTWNGLGFSTANPAGSILDPGGNDKVALDNVPNWCTLANKCVSVNSILPDSN